MTLAKTLAELVQRLEAGSLTECGVIPWSSPVPSFGDLEKSHFATLGLNPSNREFVDESGVELRGTSRRFHTLRSLELGRWSEAKRQHLDAIAVACQRYFSKNPYDGWFKRLDSIISLAGASYYGDGANACHLDLIPYATARKWTALSAGQRQALLCSSGDTLGMLLRNSPIRVLILNGNSVVSHFEKISEVRLTKRVMTNWSLPRCTGAHVPGYSYRGVIRRLGTVHLQREVQVLGFNHNIQSSFGVTRDVTSGIRKWIGAMTRKEL